MVTDNTKEVKKLLPNRYPQGELFICDVSDAVLKDIMQHMEHPFYCLSKKPETSIRRYEHNGNYIEVVPSVKGLATIYDKDILIYAISQIMAKVKSGEEVSRNIRIQAYDLLKFINRGSSGRDYLALSEALYRLGGTQIRTNIITGNTEKIHTFSLIENSTIKRQKGLDGRLLWCEITLSEWVFNAIEAQEVLTLHKDYFRLRKPLERRVYELARKHCGQQKTWFCSIDILHKKSGSKSPLKQFRYLLKEIVENDHLPDYMLEFIAEKNQILFINRNTMPSCKTKVKQNAYDTTIKISPDTYDKARDILSGWDVYYVQDCFFSWWNKIGKPDIKNPDTFFLKFCRTWKTNNGNP